MRISVGIDIRRNAREVARFLQGVSPFAPEARWVRPESLHITLKFIGEQKKGTGCGDWEALESVQSNPFEVGLAGTGFLPTPKSPRVFWVGIQAGEQLAHLAADVDAAVHELGIPRGGTKIQPAPDSGPWRR